MAGVHKDCGLGVWRRTLEDRSVDPALAGLPWNLDEYLFRLGRDGRWLPLNRDGVAGRAIAIRVGRLFPEAADRHFRCSGSGTRSPAKPPCGPCAKHH